MQSSWTNLKFVAGMLRRLAPSLLSAALVLLAAPTKAQTGSSNSASQCGAVLVARFDWPSAELLAEIVARVLRDGYGCEAKVTPASPERTAALMSAGPQGQNWPVIVAPGLPLEQEPAPDPTRVETGISIFGNKGRAGFATPEWFALGRPNLRTLAAAAAEAPSFRRPEQRRPVLTLCPKSWPCYREGLAVAHAYGLEKVFDLRPAASGAALIRELATAQRDRTPWIGYVWTPSAVAAEFPVRFLDPGAEPACNDGAPLPCAPVFPKRIDVIWFDRRLVARERAAALALRRLQISPKTLNAALIWRIENGATAGEAADHFLKSEVELWRGWVSPEAAQLIKAALATRLGASRRAAE